MRAAVAHHERLAARAAANTHSPNATLRLYQKPDRSAIVVGPDAHTISHDLFRHAEHLKPIRSTHVLSLSAKNAAAVIRSALLHQRLRVETYRAERGGAGGFELERRGSPANLVAFEAEVCGASGELPLEAAPIAAAVRLGRSASAKNLAGGGRLVGVCFADTAARTLGFAQFEDDESLSTLESLLCQQAVRELVAADDAPPPDARALAGVADACELSRNLVAPKTYGATHAEADLRRLIGGADDAAATAAIATVLAPSGGATGDDAQRLSLSAFAALYSYLDLGALSDALGTWSVAAAEPRQYMRLDAGALRALSIAPAPGDVARNASLYGLLNVTRTVGGARLLRRWLRQPLTKAADINRRLDAVSNLVSAAEVRLALRDTALPPMGLDAERIGRKLSSGRASLQDVVLLYQYVRRLPALVGVLRGEDATELLEAEFAAPLDAARADFARFEQLVEAAVDLDAVARHEFLVRPNFSAELAELADERDALQAQMDAAHEELADELGLGDGALKLEFNSQQGHHYRVSRKDELSLRGNSRYCILATRKEGVLFADAELQRTSAAHREVAARYGTAQAEIVLKVVDTASTFCPLLASTADRVATLDVLLAFATVSMSAPLPYVRPTLLPESEARVLHLVGVRHPCLEAMDGVDFIKNDVSLGGPGAPDTVQLLTGPNMGGKSTYIRSAGITALLAQVGCFVPCDAATLTPVDAVLARVGAGDQQSRGVSTFMAEMIETASILRNATPRSLVIIDELGRGTSTYDGYGIAYALVRRLASLGAHSLFATHFHELTALANEEAAVSNKHVTAHVDERGDVTMLYRVADGPADRSFGIEVAAASNFPDSVIRDAKRKLAELEDPWGEAALNTTRGSASKRAVITADDRAAGIDEVRRHLHDFAAAQLDEESGEAMTTALAKVKDALRSSENPLVVTLCATADATSF